MSATVAEIEAKLRAAMDTRLNEGVQIRPGAFIRRDIGSHGACCVIGSVIFDDPKANETEAAELASYKLGIPMSEVWEIARGFDGDSDFDDSEFSELGMRLRADYAERT